MTALICREMPCFAWLAGSQPLHQILAEKAKIAKITLFGYTASSQNPETARFLHSGKSSA